MRPADDAPYAFLANAQNVVTLRIQLRAILDRGNEPAATLANISGVRDCSGNHHEGDVVNASIPPDEAVPHAVAIIRQHANACADLDQQASRLFQEAQLVDDATPARPA